MSEIEQYNACTSSGAKGSSSNPYSQDEFYELLDSGNWEGGYVTGMGYVTPEAVVGGSDSASGSDSDSGSDSNDFSDMWPNNPQDDPEDHTNSGNDQQNQGGGGNGSGSGSGSGPQPPMPPTPDPAPYPQGNNYGLVLSPKEFCGYEQAQAEGCLSKCVIMLEKTHTSLSGGYITMTINSANGIAVSPTENVNEGIRYIDSELRKGHGVIVGVDHQAGHSMNGVNDNAAEHYVIIVSGGNGKYRFYDPATNDPGCGTSSDNVLNLQNDMLLGSFHFYDGRVWDYAVTHIRKNK